MVKAERQRSRARNPALLRMALQGLLAVLVYALNMAPALAREAAPASADPALEARVMRIANELRCLVCQNETIAASHAGLAVDLRNQVREMLRQGKSDRDIYDYMTARYGDFVLYRPPLKDTTALLWFGPVLLLGGGLVGLWLVLRRRSRLPDDRFDPDEGETAAFAPPVAASPSSLPPSPLRQDVAR